MPDDGNTPKRSNVNHRVTELRALVKRLFRLGDDLASRASDPRADLDDMEKRLHGALEKLTGRSPDAEARMATLEALETATRSGVTDQHAVVRRLLGEDDVLMFRLASADRVAFEQALHHAITAWPARGARATGSSRHQKWPAAAKLLQVLGLPSKPTSLERDWSDRKRGTTRAKRNTGKQSR